MMDRLRRQIYKGSRTEQLLRYLALGSGILVVSAIAPAAGAQLMKAGVKSYFRNKRFERKRFLRDLKNLQKRTLINFRELPSGEIEIVLQNHRNKEVVLRYQLENLHLKRPDKWDSKWRLVIFDIPHRRKKARDALRTKMRDLGFYPIQRSVFIIPWPCEEEIDFISSVFEVRQYVLILYISHFEGQEKLMDHFKLSR